MIERRFTQHHEWLEVEGEHITIGITDFAQNARAILFCGAAGGGGNNDFGRRRECH